MLSPTRSMAANGEELSGNGLRKTGLLTNRGHMAERARSSTVSGNNSAASGSFLEAGLRPTGRLTELRRKEIYNSATQVGRQWHVRREGSGPAVTVTALNYTYAA